jgi:hypothetical protein
VVAVAVYMTTSHAQESGATAFTTVTIEILARPDVDAVIVATSTGINSGSDAQGRQGRHLESRWSSTR